MPTPPNIDPQLAHEALVDMAQVAKLQYPKAIEVFRRLRVISTASGLMAAGASQEAAASQIGVSGASLSRWRRAFHQLGILGLAPRPMGGPKGHKKHFRKKEVS